MRKPRTGTANTELNGLSKQWRQLDAPANELEGLLLTKYHIFENVKTGIQNIACSQYVLPLRSSQAQRHLMLMRYPVPHNVSHHIDYITPGITLMTGGNDEKIRKRLIGRR